MSWCVRAVYGKHVAVVGVIRANDHDVSLLCDRIFLCKINWFRSCMFRRLVLTAYANFASRHSV
jgi:hypothetical protein